MREYEGPLPASGPEPQRDDAPGVWVSSSNRYIDLLGPMPESAAKRELGESDLPSCDFEHSNGKLRLVRQYIKGTGTCLISI